MITKTLSNQDAAILLRESVDGGSSITMTVQGYSMATTFIHQHTVVNVIPITQPLKRRDILLFERDDIIILHRIIRLKPLITRGDALRKIEHVQPHDIIGVVSSYRNGDRFITPHSLQDKRLYYYSRFRALITRVYHKVVKRNDS